MKDIRDEQRPIYLESGAGTFWAGFSIGCAAMWFFLIGHRVGWW